MPAHARPKPLLPPVMMAVLPSRGGTGVDGRSFVHAIIFMRFNSERLGWRVMDDMLRQWRGCAQRGVQGVLEFYCSVVGRFVGERSHTDELVLDLLDKIMQGLSLWIRITDEVALRRWVC